MARVSWLHLSDLLIGTRGSRLTLPQVREELERDLRQLHGRTGPWDLVLISGDLTQNGRANEFALLDDTLQSLWDYLRSLGSDPLLLSVPGNHDFLQRSEFQPGSASVFAPYQAWVDKWMARWQSPFFETSNRVKATIVRSARLPGDWAVRIDRDGFRFGIIGLNSAWTLDSSGALAAEQVDEATAGSGHEWCRANALSVLMTHHPPVFLSEHTPEAYAAVAPPGRFVVHLCNAGRAPDGLRGDERSRSWSVPSLFGGLTERGRALGYAAAVLEVSGLTGTLSFYPRAARLVDGTRFILAAGAGARREDESITVPVTLIGAPVGPVASVVNPVGRGGASVSAPGAGGAPPPAASVFLSTGPAPHPVAAVRAGAGIRTTDAQVGWMSFSPSGRELAMGLSNGQLVVWDVPTDRERWVIEAHRTAVQDVCWSPGGKWLASQSDYHLRVWRADDRASVPMPSEDVGSNGRCLAWSSQGVLACGGESLQLLGVEPGGVKLQQTLEVPGLQMIYALAWSPDGQVLAVGGEGDSVFLARQTAEGGFEFHYGFAVADAIMDLAWQPGVPHFVAAKRGGSIAVMSPDRHVVNPTNLLIEGHTDSVTSVGFSPDGRILASKSLDGKVRLYRTDTWAPVAELAEPVSRQAFAGLAFSPASASPSTAILATLAPGEGGVRLWNIDVDALLAATADEPADARSVYAKVVLIGEGRAGKSCVALRLVKDEYGEMASTHGMRFWSVAAERFADPTASPAPAVAHERREIVLWDLGGQSEYRLVHQLFLRDAAVALLAMEPGRGQPALDEIEGWIRHLPPELTDGRRPVRKILVGTKVDDEHAPLDLPAIEALVAREKLAGFVATSSRTGRGIAELKARLGRELDWDALGRTSQPRLFRRIQKHIQALIAGKRVVLPYGELERDLRQEQGAAYDPEAVHAVVGQLARQGVLADTRMADGSRALILDVEQIERYAGSLILAARENRSGLPAIDLGAVLAARAPLPRMAPEDRLPRDQEMVVIDCVVELLLEHGVCVRHQGLLIFPSLFPPAQQPDPAARRDVALVYSFTGAVETIYPSLVSAVSLSRAFGPMRLWEDRAEFGRAGESGCGIRKMRAPESRARETRGLARLEIYFDAGTSEELRGLFVNVVEEHLRERAVELLEEEAITCVCGFVFTEDTVQKRAALGFGDLACPVCEVRTPITVGAQQAREKDPGLVERVRALRLDMRTQRQQAVAETKATLNEVQRAAPLDSVPLRILHLSDLHVGADADPKSLLQPLLADLRDTQEGLGIERLDYLVVSGDITNRASQAEFDRAREFLSLLIEELGLTSQRCILVPGNHDLDWNTDVYAWKKKRQVDVATLGPGSYHVQGDLFGVRDDALYPQRFRNFSASLYHPLLQREYPLPVTEQCVPHLFAEDGLQVLAMNSAWEIDEYFPARSSLNDAALSRGLILADEQVAAERTAGRLAAGRQVLRIAVWHHPITGNEKIVADAFLGRLQQAGVRVCLHGHVHEERADVLKYLTPTRQIHAVGAGSFGAPTNDRPESTPRLYNLLELSRDHGTLTVHTRARRRQGGAWEGWAVWPSQQRGDRRSRYVLSL